ncbi:hypothetical protein AB1Y20_017719 [Prymnesium parvum]|uniref:Uncharacterized protein n=1 Tax=Prymnesium parvum TaxID=97485 RepID=A0AB34JMX8_PRYPA
MRGTPTVKDKADEPALLLSLQEREAHADSSAAGSAKRMARAPVLRGVCLGSHTCRRSCAERTRSASEIRVAVLFLRGRAGYVRQRQWRPAGLVRLYSDVLRRQGTKGIGTCCRTARHVRARSGGWEESGDRAMLLDLEGLTLKLGFALMERLPSLQQLCLQCAEVVQSDALHGKRQRR